MGQADNQIIDTTADTTRSKNNSSAETAETKRGRGRPRKSESGAAAAAATETDFPRVVLVDTPEIPEEENKEEKKPKRKRKDIQFELKKEQVSILIKTCFDIAASREGLELWKLSQKESDLIAEPLAAILNKNPMIGAVTNKYGDVIALVVAAATVLIPRVMLQMAAKPKIKKGVQPYAAIKQTNGQQGYSNTSSPSGNENRSHGSNHKQPIRQPANASANFSGKLSQLISPIQ